MSDIFDQIGEAEVPGAGGNFKPGEYVLELQRIKFKPNGFKGISYVPEMIVREAKEMLPGVPPNPVGSIVSFPWNLSGGGDAVKQSMALGNVKAFVLALTNTTTMETTKEEIAQVTRDLANDDPRVTGKDPDGTEYMVGVQPGRGRLVKALAKEVTTKKGQTFWVPVFSGIPQTTEEIEARRKAQ
jgi:hypothetical protein